MAIIRHLGCRLFALCSPFSFSFMLRLVLLNWLFLSCIQTLLLGTLSLAVVIEGSLCNITLKTCGGITLLGIDGPVTGYHPGTARSVYVPWKISRELWRQNHSFKHTGIDASADENHTSTLHSGHKIVLVSSITNPPQPNSS
jgi:hypothetical protein